jgi:hypothetical protein
MAHEVLPTRCVGNVLQPAGEVFDTDEAEFEGTVRIRDSYYRKSGEDSSDRIYLKVAFGFRACRNGEWAVAAYAPDLVGASPDERRLWTGFEIGSEQAFANAEQDDPRFQKWVSRYIMGNWDVEDGPIATLDQVVMQVNAITECVVNAPLFTVTDLRSLCFPLAQNTHRYEDAHAEVYRLIVDGLDRKAIKGDNLLDNSSSFPLFLIHGTHHTSGSNPLLQCSR